MPLGFLSVSCLCLCSSVAPACLLSLRVVLCCVPCALWTLSVVCRYPRVLLEAGVRRRSVVPFRPVRCAVLASTLHPRFTSTYPLHLRCSGASTFICACSAPPFARSLTLLTHTPALPLFIPRYLSLTPSIRFVGARHPSSRHSTLLRYLYVTFTRTSLSPFCPPPSPPPPRPTRPHLGYVSTTPTTHAHDHRYDHDALRESIAVSVWVNTAGLPYMTCRLGSFKWHHMGEQVGRKYMQSSRL